MFPGLENIEELSSTKEVSQCVNYTTLAQEVKHRPLSIYIGGGTVMVQYNVINITQCTALSSLT